MTQPLKLSEKTESTFKEGSAESIVKRRHADFKLVTTDYVDGSRNVEGSWTNDRGVPCSAKVFMPAHRTPNQENFFNAQLCAVIARMVAEDNKR